MGDDKTEYEGNSIWSHSESNSRMSDQDTVSMHYVFVVNSVKIVLLVFARDQGAILVLVPGPSLITCSSHSFNILFF